MCETFVRYSKGRGGVIAVAQPQPTCIILGLSNAWMVRTAGAGRAGGGKTKLTYEQCRV